MGALVTTKVLLVDYLVRLLDPVYRIDLYDNDVVPTVDSVWADFDIASFAGYAPQDITFGTPFWDAVLQKAVTDASVAFFAPSSDLGSPYTIYGYKIWAAGGAHLLHAQRFDTPLAIQYPSDAFGIAVRLTLDYEH